MKKFIIGLMVLFVVCSLWLNQADAATYVNGELVSSIVKDGRTLVPVRVVSENLGATVNWDNNSRTVTIIKGNKHIYLVIGQKWANVNYTEYPLDVPAQIINGKTYVPMRVVADGLGVAITWDGRNAHIGGTIVATPSKPNIKQNRLTKQDFLLDLVNSLNALKTGVTDLRVEDAETAGYILVNVKERLHMLNIYDYDYLIDLGLLGISAVCVIIEEPLSAEELKHTQRIAERGLDAIERLSDKILNDNRI